MESFIMCLLLILFTQLDVELEAFAIDFDTTTAEPEETTNFVFDEEDIKYVEITLTTSTPNHANERSSLEETTLPFELTKVQQEILSELESIWDYSESLEGSNAGLKTKLTSLVHFTYARIQTEPEEMLDRLKYLLVKLRSRLNGEVVESPNVNVQGIPETVREKRSMGYIDNGTEDFLASNVIEQLMGKMGDKYVTMMPYSGTTSSFKIHTPGKTNHVLSKNVAVAEPITIQPMFSKNVDSEEVTPITPTSMLHQNQTSIENIEKDIIQLLNTSCRNMSSFLMNTTTAPTPAFLWNNVTNNTATPTNFTNNILTLSSSFSTNGSEYLNKNPDLYLCYMITLIEKQNVINQTNQTPKRKLKFPPLPLPSYVDDLLGRVVEKHENKILTKTKNNSSFPSKWLGTNQTRNGTSNTSQLWAVPFDYDFQLDYEGHDFEDNETNFTSEDEESPPIILNILEGLTALSEIDPVLAPVSVLNATRDGIIRFVVGFNRLRKLSKVIIIFVISITIITGGVGIYKLAPPVLFGAILSALLPLVLMLVLENVKAGGGKKKTKQSDVESQIEELTDCVLSLISQAIKKYNS